MHDLRIPMFDVDVLRGMWKRKKKAGEKGQVSAGKLGTITTKGMTRKEHAEETGNKGEGLGWCWNILSLAQKL